MERYRLLVEPPFSLHVALMASAVMTAGSLLSRSLLATVYPKVFLALEIPLRFAAAVGYVGGIAAIGICFGICTRWEKSE